MDTFKQLLIYPVNYNKVYDLYCKELINDKYIAMDALACIYGYAQTMDSVMQEYDKKNISMTILAMKDELVSKYDIIELDKARMTWLAKNHSISFIKDKPSCSKDPPY